jgi:hypothetical protein
MPNSYLDEDCHAVDVIAMTKSSFLYFICAKNNKPDMRVGFVIVEVSV